MPCELLAFPFWLVVSHRYFSTLCETSIIAFRFVHAFIFPAPGCFSPVHLLILVQLTIQGKLRSLEHSVYNSLLSGTLHCKLYQPWPPHSLLLMAPQAWTLPSYSSTAPWHATPLGKTLGKQRDSLCLFISLILLLLPDVSVLETFVLCICLFCWCLGWSIILFHLLHLSKELKS